MAALASTAVTITRRWKNVGCVGGNVITVAATLVLSGQGSVANSIPAALFGMSAIHSVGNVTGDDNTMYIGAPSYDGAQVLLVTNAAANGTPADVTDTVRLTVTGAEKLN